MYNNYVHLKRILYYVGINIVIHNKTVVFKIVIIIISNFPSVISNWIVLTLEKNFVIIYVLIRLYYSKSVTWGLIVLINYV